MSQRFISRLDNEHPGYNIRNISPRDILSAFESRTQQQHTLVRTILKTSPSIPPQSIPLIVQHSRVRVIHNEHLYRIGEHPKYFYIMLQGQVSQLSQQNRPQNPHPLTKHSVKGQIFGDQEYLQDLQTRQSFVFHSGREPAVVCYLPLEKLYDQIFPNRKKNIQLLCARIKINPYFEAYTEFQLLGFAKNARLLSLPKAVPVQGPMVCLVTKGSLQEAQKIPSNRTRRKLTPMEIPSRFMEYVENYDRLAAKIVRKHRNTIHMKDTIVRIRQFSQPRFLTGPEGAELLVFTVPEIKPRGYNLSERRSTLRVSTQPKSVREVESSAGKPTIYVGSRQIAGTVQVRRPKDLQYRNILSRREQLNESPAIFRTLKYRLPTS